MSHTQSVRTLARLITQLPTVTCEDANAFLLAVTRHPAFVATQVAPLLSHVSPGRHPTIRVSYGARERATCLQVFIWPAGAATPIHDHTAWGAYYCLFGSLVEDRYVRLDDGAQPSTARLRKAWRRSWRREDGASTVHPYALGIHRITNPNSAPAVSVHLYGPRMGIYDGRDYDPARDFVCDRLEQDDLACAAEMLFDR